MSTKHHTRRSIPRLRRGSKEYFLWCDESGCKCRHYSNFYGGVLVGSDDLKFVHNSLSVVCKRLRLNEKHWEIPTGQTRRSNHTIAKEKLYNHIIAKIREITPGFLIGVNTGIKNKEDHWRRAYRHLNLIPDKKFAQLPALIS